MISEVKAVVELFPVKLPHLLYLWVSNHHAGSHKCAWNGPNCYTIPPRCLWMVSGALQYLVMLPHTHRASLSWFPTLVCLWTTHTFLYPPKSQIGFGTTYVICSILRRRLLLDGCQHLIPQGTQRVLGGGHFVSSPLGQSRRTEWTWKILYCTDASYRIVNIPSLSMIRLTQMSSLLVGGLQWWWQKW